MKSNQSVSKIKPLMGRAAGLMLLARLAGAAPWLNIQAATNVLVWDTSAPLAGAVDPANRAGWKIVPSELYVFEAEPAKAASDPGYHGREYDFQGDAVVENRHLTAVFWSAQGRVVLYSKVDPAPPAATEGAASLGRKVFEFVPALFKSRPGKISRCEIVRNAGDEAVVEISFALPGSEAVSAVFVFGKNEIVEIQPGAAMKGMRLLSPVEYGVVPGFIGDDLIFGAAAFPAAESLAIPAENVFVGLLKGEDTALVMTWPKGQQQLKLGLANDAQGGRVVESVDFDNAGESLYLAALSAPGIWRREALQPAYLEKDVALAWKRPYPAKWKTQLSEAGVPATYAFRETKGTIWRGVPGSYNYPAWFEGEKACFHLSKKVPPKGEALIYFLEGQNTPASVLTPVDVMRATLGRPMSAAMLDVAGRKLRTHHRRGGDGVHRACTCGCTEAIQAVFEKKQEFERKDYIREALGDMNFFVTCHVDRIEEYRRFAAEMIQFLQGKAAAAPELKPYLERLEETARQIPQEYEVQKENMESPEHAAELTRQTLALTGSPSTNNLPAYMDLLKAWRAMGGAQDYVVAQCHTITRKLFQEAGYGCAHDPKAIPVAREVRARCRQVLRNPDGYEIWSEY